MAVPPSDRFKPNYLDTEMRLLGALMLTVTSIMPEILTIVRESDFAAEEHRVLFAAITGLYLSGSRIDAMEVRGHLISAELFESAGGIEYLARVLSTVSNAAECVHDARQVREAAVRRRAGDN